MHLRTKYLVVDWYKRQRPDGRRYRLRHNRRAHNFYLQAWRLEIVWWYR